jgi:tetratricopeptide (TPR) repeat protein
MGKKARSRAVPARVPPAKTVPWRDIGLGALLFCAVSIAYGPALQGGMLWDDDHHLTPPALQPLRGLWLIWSNPAATHQYYPLLHSAFWFEHRLWGDSVLGYHLVNVLLHAAAACLVVAIVRRLALPGAWLAGFLFALHPVCVEAVAWISEQKSTLSAAFYLAALLAYLRFDRSRRSSHYAAASALFVLALLSKTVTATLPAALLLVFWFQRGRIDWKRDARPLLPWFALGAGGGLFTAWVERNYIGAQGTQFALTPVGRFLVAGRDLWFYLGKLVWPRELMFTYPHWTVDSGEWWQYLFPLGAVAAAWGLWKVARNHRGPLAGFLYFAGTLFPALGFFNVYPFVYSYVADHFQYLAALGILVPAASGLTVAARKLPAVARRFAPAAAVALAAVLGGLSWAQSGMYRDAETLYRETLERNPGAWMAHNNLGSLLDRTSGRLPEVIAEYQAAIRIRPDVAEVHFNLGNALSKIRGRRLDAIGEYQAALRIQPNFPEAHFNLGNVLASFPDRLPDAIAEYRAALRFRPGFADAHCNLGNALAELPGRLPDAIAEYQAALRIQPDDAEAHNGLGNCFSALPDRSADAISEYQAAIRIQPDLAEAHYNLAGILAAIPGRLPEAIAEYEATLRSDPDLAEAHYALGLALAQTPGRSAEAIAHLEAALRLRPDLRHAQEVLAGLQRSR